MKRPQDFNKSALVCQAILTVFYLVSSSFVLSHQVDGFQIIGSVIYYYAGQYVSSPALGTGGLIMKRGRFRPCRWSNADDVVCYGIALPGLFAGGILLT